MRIVGGRHKGRRLTAPDGLAVRPTSDRTREALFNILAGGRMGISLEGARVLDAFAGTGALGLEALSRDGRKVLMVCDGLNDAPTLAAAFVSASPAAAAEVSQTAADFVLQGRGLPTLREAVTVARLTRRLSLQNFGEAQNAI